MSARSVETPDAQSSRAAVGREKAETLPVVAFSRGGESSDASGDSLKLVDPIRFELIGRHPDMSLNQQQEMGMQSMTTQLHEHACTSSPDAIRQRIDDALAALPPDQQIAFLEGILKHSDLIRARRAEGMR